MLFSEARVAQMSAYLLKRRGGRMAYLKLLKLLYLADRQSMSRYGESISGDCMVAMPHGPVLSRTYDLILCGSLPTVAEDGWNEWIQAESNYEVSLKKQHFTRDDLDELSDIN